MIQIQQRAPCHAAHVEYLLPPPPWFYSMSPLPSHDTRGLLSLLLVHQASHRAEMSRHIAASSLRSGESLAEVLSTRTHAMVLR